MEYFIKSIKKYVQVLPLVITSIVCICFYVCLHYMAKKSRVNNVSITHLNLNISQPEVPTTHYWNDVLNENLIEISQNNVDNSEVVTSIFTGRADIKNSVHGNYKYSSLYDLLPYMLLYNQHKLEYKSLSHFISSQFNGKVSLYNNYQIYDDLVENYFDKIYLESIKNEWEYENFYKVRNLAFMLRMRFNLLKFESYANLPSDILYSNNRITLTILASMYPDIYSERRDIAKAIGKIIFEDSNIEVLNSLFKLEIPPKILPFCYYLNGVHLLYEQNFEKALSAFNKVKQCSLNKDLLSYSTFMCCRTLFWLYKSSPTNNNRKRFIDECLESEKIIDNENLLIDLKEYGQAIDSEE